MITGMFLEVLEPYILKDMLGSLPPEVSSIRIYTSARIRIHNEFACNPIVLVDYASTSGAL
jgi:hypothetical protein